MTLPRPLGGTHVYRKIRDRASYAFATVSVAMVEAPGGRRWAFGGIGTRPWRVEAADHATGADGIAETVLAGARPTSQNRFKLTVTRRAIAAVLAEA